MPENAIKKCIILSIAWHRTKPKCSGSNPTCWHLAISVASNFHLIPGKTTRSQASEASWRSTWVITGHQRDRRAPSRPAGQKSGHEVMSPARYTYLPEEKARPSTASCAPRRKEIPRVNYQVLRGDTRVRKGLTTLMYTRSTFKLARD